MFRILLIFLNRGKFVFSILGIIILICTFFLFHLKKNLVLDFNLAIGKVSYIENTAERKPNTKQVWYELLKNDLVMKNDTIKTDENSTIQIELNNQNKFTFFENTMVILDLKDEETEIQFKKGKAKIFANKKTKLKLKENLNIEIPRGHAEFGMKNDSFFILNQKESTKIILNSEEKLIPPNQFVEIEDDKITTKTIYDKIISPNDDIIRYTDSEDSVIDWEFEKILDDKVIILMSKDSNFNSIFFKDLILKDEYKKKLPLGIYYWKLVSTSKEKDFFYPTKKISILKINPVQFLKPNLSKELSYFSYPKDVFFQWKPLELFNEYELQFSDKEDFSNLKMSFKTSQTILKVPILEEGKIYFRLKAKSNREEVLEFISKIFFIQFLKKEKVPEVSVFIPLENGKVSVAKNSNDKIYFYWEKDYDFKEYNFQLSYNEDFKNIALEQKINDSSISISGINENQTYYWRVRGIVNNEVKSNYSNIRKLQVVMNDPTIINILFPYSGKILELNEKNKILFRWKTVDKTDRFFFELASDNDFKNKILTKELSNTELELKDLKEGTYFWKVTSPSNSLRREATSEKVSFQILYSNSADEILVPDIGNEQKTYFIDK